MCFIHLYNICEQIDKCLRNKYKNVKNVVNNCKIFSIRAFWNEKIGAVFLKKRMNRIHTIFRNCCWRFLRYAL